MQKMTESVADIDRTSSLYFVKWGGFPNQMSFSFINFFVSTFRYHLEVCVPV